MSIIWLLNSQRRYERTALAFSRAPAAVDTAAFERSFRKQAFEESPEPNSSYSYTHNSLVQPEYVRSEGQDRGKRNIRSQIRVFTLLAGFCERELYFHLGIWYTHQCHVVVPRATLSRGARAISRPYSIYMQILLPQSSPSAHTPFSTTTLFATRRRSSRQWHISNCVLQKENYLFCRFTVGW